MSGSGGAFKVSRAQVAASSTAEKTITMMRQKMMLIECAFSARKWLPLFRDIIVLNVLLSTKCSNK